MGARGPDDRFARKLKGPQLARAPDQDDHDRSIPQTVLRWITIAAGTLAVILIAISLAAHVLVDEDAVSALIRSSIAGSESRSLSVGMTSVTPTLLSRSLRADGVRIALDGSPPATIEATGDGAGAGEADSAEAGRLVVTIGTVELEGVDLGRLALGNGFVVEEARFVDPRVQFHRLPKEETAADSSADTSSSGRQGGFAPSLP